MECQVESTEMGATARHIMTDRPYAISTWFVADNEAEATYFPQIDSQSNSPDVQAVYWRCAVVFFASSIAVNPRCRHMMFTNSEIPVIDGLDIRSILTSWGVEIVNCPITWRLPLGSVTAWGNQFYVFDIMEYWERVGERRPLIILDSDCVWTRSAEDIFEAIEKYGALAYELDYPHQAEVNGLTTEQMAKFLAKHSRIKCNSVPYCAGEFIAASSEMISRIIHTAKELWPAVTEQGPNCPREEAHFLSIIYAMEGIIPGTGNIFIKRMWTAFSYSNVTRADLRKTIWHLPAEKRTGFADLFPRLASYSADDLREKPQTLGLGTETYSKFFGIPRRGPYKLVRDAARKLRDKLKVVWR